MTAAFRLNEGCYYLDDNNRTYGPIDLDGDSNLFTFKSVSGAGAFLHIWKSNGVAVGSGPNLIKEFVPTIVTNADFGIPSEQFGHLIEAIEQLIPGVQDDPDNEIIAFSYEQFFQFGEKFGLLGDWRERVKTIVIDASRKENRPMVVPIASFAEGDEDLAKEFAEAFEELADQFGKRADKREAKRRASEGIADIINKMKEDVAKSIPPEINACDCPVCQSERSAADRAKADGIFAMASDQLISSALASAMLSGKIGPDMSQDELLAVVLDEMADRMGPLGPSFKAFMQSRMPKKN